MKERSEDIQMGSTLADDGELVAEVTQSAERVHCSRKRVSGVSSDRNMNVEINGLLIRSLIGLSAKVSSANVSVSWQRSESVTQRT